MSFGSEQEEHGSAHRPTEVSDPRALRALAHPARLTILEHLIVDGPATATECAEIAGLSPSACSYHLRALARHGFAEEDPAGGADRRHRPWRARVAGISIGSPAGRPDAVRIASRVLVENAEVRYDELRASYRDREAQYPAEWQAAAGSALDVLHVTAAELEQVNEQVRAVLDKYRRLDRTERPEDSRRVYVMVDFTPGFPPDPPPRPAQNGA